MINNESENTENSPQTPKSQSTSAAPTPSFAAPTPSFAAPTPSFAAPTPTTIELKLQANRNLKIVKSHCVFYDLLIYEEIEKMIGEESKKYGHYKELFEEQYDHDVVSEGSSEIDLFFNTEGLTTKNKLLKSFEAHSDTLFVIPTFFNSETSIELFNKNKNVLRGDHKIYQGFYEGAKSSQGSSSPQTPQIQQPQTALNIYYLPCLIRNAKININENEYVKKLQTELLELQEYLKQDFLKKIEVGNNAFKKLNVFCDPNGDISLKFYKNVPSKTNVEFLNKYLFKDLVKLKENIQGGKQKLEETNKIIQPLVYKKRKTQIDKDYTNAKDKFFAFLVQKILTGEILSKFDVSRLTDIEGIKKLDILFYVQIKKDLNDFNMKSCQTYKFTGKTMKDRSFEFRLHDNERGQVENYKSGKNLFTKHWKINIVGNLPQCISNEDISQEDIYLRITSNNVLKNASIYVKKRNSYEDLNLKGIIQLSPKKEIYKQLDITNLSRELQDKRMYYLENFNFTMESFKQYIEQSEQNNSKLPVKKISKETMRNNFIKTFTSKKLLSDYYLFCLNDSRFKKNISKDSDKRNAENKIIINSLMKELFKKGSKFYINQKKNQESKYSSETSTKTYNKYITKRFNQNHVKILLGPDNERSDFVTALESINTLGHSNKFLDQSVQNKMSKYDQVLVRIILEEDDGSEHVNNNSNISEFINPKQGKCAARKKTLNKEYQKILKKGTQKLHFSLRAIF
jgi:hypothetical protein